jgi:hypothetical protein
MFPGAKLLTQRKPEQVKQRGVKGLVSLLYATEASEITTVELQWLTGISFQKNKVRYLSEPVVQRAMEDTKFTFQPGRGRGNPGRFVRMLSLAA